MKLPLLFEIKTYDNRNWALTEPDYKMMNERLEAGARFLTIPDGSQSKVAVANIKFFGKRQISMGDIISEQKGLPQGKPKEFDKLSKGYIKFLAMSIKVKVKHGVKVSDLDKRISDEQRPLINAELKKLGVDFQL